MDGEALRAQARACGFKDLADDLVKLARPGFVLESHAGGGIVAGRLGGLPNLPIGDSWPRCRWPGYESEPLSFVAEFDLSALDQTIWPGPDTGTLSFFCAIDAEALYVDSGGAALVVHHPPGTARSLQDFPASLHEDLRYRDLRVDARAVTTLPFGATDPEADVLGLYDMDEDRLESYFRMRADVMGIPAYWAPHHQLLGWPRTAEDGLSDLWPSLHADAVELELSTDDPPPTEWRVLLQVGSDYDRIGAQFGDGGALTFAIPDADLAAGRFDRVQAITDSM